MIMIILNSFEFTYFCFIHIQITVIAAGRKTQTKRSFLGEIMFFFSSPTLLLITSLSPSTNKLFFRLSEYIVKLLSILKIPF